MRVITTAFFSTLGFCVIALVLLNRGNNSMNGLNPPSDKSFEASFLTKPQPREAPVTSEPEKSYQFVNPTLAYKVLTVLDEYQPTEHKRRFNTAFLGLTKKDNYCEKHRAYVVEHPDLIFERRNFFIEEPPGSFTRNKVLRPLGNDLHPKISMGMSKKQRRVERFDLKPHINIFFSKNDMQPFMDVGKHFSCLTQEYNHIPGHNSLARKDLVAQNVIKYAETFKDRPQCFNFDKFFPKTWLLYDEEQCKEFFKNINSTDYQSLKEERRIVYIRKIGKGSHRGEGVQPVNEKEEERLRNIYDNGNKCGTITKNYLVQNFVHNPLLLEGHKFDFRMYMLIASTNPLMVYYHDGFLRVTLADYDMKSDDKKVLLTNLALNQQIYDDVKKGRLYEGKDEETLKLAQQWSFARLQEYLLEQGIISDPDWLDNYLRPEFKRAMIHLVRLSSDAWMRKSPLYELQGVDFMLDRNLNLWFIEANSGPAFKGYSKPMEKFILKMLSDHLEVVTGLMKSRMKRIINYVNELIDYGMVQELKKSQVKILDFQSKKQVFEEITKNYFEEEFEPKATNGFSKIIDENYQGVQKYRGFVQNECL